MFDVGVSDIAIYIPPYYLPHEELAKARGIPKEKFHIGLGNYKMAIIPNWEDAITMAANAASHLLEKTGTEPDEIRELVVGTESSVDHSKPIASFVHGLLKIGPRCRSYDIKHACYGGSAGLVSCIDRAYRITDSTYKAIVIMTDICRYDFGSPGEPTQGAGAVALLVRRNPCLFSMDTSLNGIFTKHVFDFWRPIGHDLPIVDGEYSIECYLMALEGAISHFCYNLGIKWEKLLGNLDYIIYHLPFGKMATKAHRHLIEIAYKDLDSESREALYTETYYKKVAPGLLGVKEVGNIYTGSVYMGLVSLLETEGDKVEGKNVGIFSYGSGCGAEFFLCHMKSGIDKIIRGLRFKEQLDGRKKITFEQYTQIYSRSCEEVDYYPEEVQIFKGPLTRFVFTGFKDHKRQYV